MPQRINRMLNDDTMLKRRNRNNDFDDADAETDDLTDDDTDAETDDLTDDDTDAETDDLTDDDTDAETDDSTDDDTDATIDNTRASARSLHARLFPSTESETVAKTSDAPLGMTDYKPVYNQLLDAVRDTPDDYARIARLFDDFTARLTGEHNDERVEDATHALVELGGLVFGRVPYPYNSSILADLMELASYAGYADAQLLFYVWATLLDCARLVREYGYNEAIRRTFGVTRQIIQRFSEDDWQAFAQDFLGATDNADAPREPSETGIGNESGSGRGATPDATPSANAGSTETTEPEFSTGSTPETPATAPKFLNTRADTTLPEPPTVPNYTPIGRRYEEETP